MEQQINLNQLEQLYDNIPQKLIIQLFTKQSEYKIEIQQLQLNNTITDINLNEIIKKLLENQINNNISINFHFLVENYLLRGNLKSHLIRYNLLTENIIHVQYFIAFKSISSSKIIQQNDWISTLTNLQTIYGNILGVALYSGTISFYNNQPIQIKHKSISKGPLKDMKVIPCLNENQYYIINGGLQEQLIISLIKCKKNQCSLQIICTNDHEGNILGIDVNPIMDGLFCTVGSNSTLTLWKIPSNFLEEEQKKTKMKKIHKTNKNLKKQYFQKIHNSSIQCVCWMNTSTIITGSSDHSIKLYDVQKQLSMTTMLTKDSITTALDCAINQVLSSHEDGYIRLWDPRASIAPVTVFKSHAKLTSSIQFNRNHHIFASGSYDTTIKIWDTRSIFPLQNIGTHLQKVFSVIWKNQNQLISGGSDSNLIYHYI